MPDTLCIAELADGRRALCYINPEEGKAQLLLVLRPEDCKPRPWHHEKTRLDRGPRTYLVMTGPDGPVGPELEVVNPQPLHTPTPPPRRPITLGDLLNMAAQAAQGRECPMCGTITNDEHACHNCHYRFEA